MKQIRFQADCKFFEKYENIFSFTEAVNHLYNNRIGIFILLSHYKAKVWPRKRISFNKEADSIPIVWALFHADRKEEIIMDYGIHPVKCFPQQYNKFNQNSDRYPLPIGIFENKTLGGCGTDVNISGNEYSSCQKTTQYCSAFGLPDDCFYKDFEKNMLGKVGSYKDLELWCFEKTEYIRNKIDPFLDLNFMWEDFLPSVHYFYVDKSGSILRGLFRAKDLEILNKEIWYLSGRELINGMEISNLTSPLFEEDTVDMIKKRILCEFIRQQLLLKNKERIKSSYSLPESSKFQIKRKRKVDKRLNRIIGTIEEESTTYLNSLLQSIKDMIIYDKFKRSRVLIMDLEFIRIENPINKNSRFIRNFPCVISNIMWHGPRKMFSTHINVFFLPCNICVERPCGTYKKTALQYECLQFTDDFVNKEIQLLKELLERHQNLKIFTYGRSDICELEYAINFITNSSDYLKFKRKNRKIDRRLIELHNDMSVQETSLKSIEDQILKKWIHGWSRNAPVIKKKNKKFMRTYDSGLWEKSYAKVINACIYDAISCFLYLLHEKFKIQKDSDDSSHVKTLSNFF